MTHVRSVIASTVVAFGAWWAESVAYASQAMKEPLRLGQVLESVEEHYPLLAAVLEERSIADAKLLSKQGAFDLRLGAGGKVKPRGFYETYQGGLSVEQPTTFWGMDLFAGYRIGVGNFAPWYGGDQTNDGGEFRAGFRLPILRDRDIDERRAALRKAGIAVDAADPVVRESLIAFSRAAAFSYWNWVAAGMRVSVARQLLQTAEERKSQLERRVEKGALPRIDLADNERLIVDRRVLLIAAERAFEQAAIDLSLFLRDSTGEPVIVPEDRLLAEFPAESRPDDAWLERDIERAFAQQPILQKMDFDYEQAKVDLKLAENRLLPQLNLTLGGSQDVGGAAKFPDDKGPGVLEARIDFEFPVQRREARGQVAESSSKMRQIESKRRFARDRIAADVRNAMAALRAAYDQVDAARRNLELAITLRRAEERKLLLGTSNLINVNIREVQAFDAASTVIVAQADYFRASANYRAALGETAGIEPQPASPEDRTETRAGSARADS